MQNYIFTYCYCISFESKTVNDGKLFVNRQDVITPDKLRVKMFIEEFSGINFLSCLVSANSLKYVDPT